MISPQGCLGAETTERYTAFLEDDFEMEYDAMEDPAYLKTITTGEIVNRGRRIVIKGACITVCIIQIKVQFICNHLLN